MCWGVPTATSVYHNSVVKTNFSPIMFIVPILGVSNGDTEGPAL